MPPVAITALQGAKVAEDATEGIFRAHAQEVSRWAQALGGPGADAAEVVQEVFLIVHSRLPTFRGEAQLRTWLYGITVNVLRRRRRRDRLRRWFLGGTATEVAGDIEAPDPTPGEAAERREAAAEIYRVLEGMPEKYRNALVLFEIEERSAEEIAALTGARVGTVWVWLHRARAQFQQRLARQRAEQQYDDDDEKKR